MSRLPRLTARQAEAAVGRAGESLALTSGAGCGKTLVLARRFTELVMRAKADEGSPFERFVALTFTDKAALEMLSRVRAVLLEALSRSKSAGDRRKLAAWITELPAAHISTIHSFCASLLRRHAVEAGVDPDFAVCADELVTAQMISEAAEQAVLSAVEARRTEVLELLARADLARVAGDVQTLMARRIAWQQSDYADPEQTLQRWDRLRQELCRQQLSELRADGAIREELAYLEGYPCSDPADKLNLYREAKLALARELLAGKEAVTAMQLAGLSEKAGGIGSQRAWGGKEGLLEFRGRLRDFLERFAQLGAYLEPLGADDADATRCLAALTALAGDAVARHDRAKRRAGLLDFDDLIFLTGRLLRESPAVRASLRGRLGQLLLDECQDTDAYQLEMLWRLLADGQRPPPGKLFIVGDLKQSIYRFRGAQAEVFQQLCRRFGEARIPLEESFRVHAAGAAFVNHVFSQLMGTEYEPITSSRAERPAGQSVEILLAQPDEPGDAEAGTIAQADLIAQRIAEMVGKEKLVFDAQARQWRTARPGDVAVLFARMTHSVEYERALRQRGLPYYVVAGTGFFRQQEVYDVLNALRVIDDPFDDVALFGVLRSAIFGLDDNALLHIASSARPPYFAKLDRPEVLNRLPAAQREQLGFARGLLGRLHRDKDALGAAVLIARLLAESGYAAGLLGEFQGRRKLGNVLRLVEAARSAQAGGRVSLADFVKRYGELSLEQSRYEQAPVVGEADDVVRVMTIHKAKGLEFPVVIIPDLNAGRRGLSGGLLLRHDWGITYRPPDVVEEDAGPEEAPGRRKSEPVSFRLAAKAEKAELAAEDVRKLYVAATRHQDHLILVGADRRDARGCFKDSGSYLAQLDGVLGIAEAVDRGQEQIAYGKGFSARVARIAPRAPSGKGRRRPIGQRIVASSADPASFAEALSCAGEAAELPLVGPLARVGGPAPAGRIAATALADFAHCSRLYRWRHELRVPTELPLTVRPAGASDSALDAATAGTLLHRCMELLDFSALAGPAAGSLAAPAQSLVARATGEMELAFEPAGLAEELAGMLSRMAGHPLLRQVAAARTRLAELPLLYRAGGLDIAGQIDLLYQDAEGTWHVLDYKSDRIGPGQAESHAQRYELQMRIYLAAAARHLATRCRPRSVGAAVADAAVYFLRPAEAHRFAADEQALADLEQRLAVLADELLQCRRSGQFPRRGGATCPGCPYSRLCLRGGGGQSAARA